MFFAVFAGISILLALFALYFGVRTLGKLGWITGFIRGAFGFMFVALAVIFTLVALDFISYKQLTDDKPILTISFEKLDEKLFRATVVFIEADDEEKYEIKGEQWQVDARVIRWKGIVSTFGAKPGYRLDRLSGRYYSLEEERRNERSVFSLDTSKYGLDLWQWAQEYGRYMPVIEAVYGSATYLPMADGAIFQISLTSTGLATKPLNKVAEESVNQWM